MSGRRSGRERERARDADPNGSTNAQGTQPSYEDLQRMPLELLVAEPSWHDNREPDFQRRVVANYHRIADNGDNVPRTFQYPGSITSSMAASDHSRSTAPSNSTGSQYSVYSLQHSPMTSGAFVRTGIADGHAQPSILDQRHGLTDSPVSSDSGLPCAYGFLACSFYSNNFYVWEEHCRSHFQGHLPTQVWCPFECLSSFSGATGAETWNLRNAHIARDHGAGGRIDQNRRADRTLIDHLWQQDLVSGPQVEELLRYGRLVGLRRSRDVGQAPRGGRGNHGS